MKNILKMKSERKKKVVIFGAAETGQKVYDKLSQDKTVDVIAFVDNFKKGIFCNLDILRPEQLNYMEFDRIYIGSPRRNEIITELLNRGIGLSKIESPLFEKLLVILRRPLQLLENFIEIRVLKDFIINNKLYGVARFMPEYAVLCNPNSKFKDVHSGERCFILGTGPSLRDVDLSLLADEFVFTCNFFSQVKDYKKAKTNVHVFTDSAFFCLNDKIHYDEEQLWTNYRAIAEEAPLCFVPTWAHDFIDNNGLDRLLNINYFCDSVPVLPTKLQDIPYDLCAPISSCYSVVQDIIHIALYMGFKEIYLLGCDSTGVIPYIETLLKENISRVHAYDTDYTARYAAMDMERSLTKDIFFFNYGMFYTYKRLYELCLKKDVKLINCSSKTIINEIPRMDLSEVLGK